MAPWLNLGVVARYMDWYSNAGLPEWLMWPLPAWLGIHSAVIFLPRPTWRILFAPVMFAVSCGGVLVLCYQITTVWEESSIRDAMRMSVSIIPWNAVPALTATILGFVLTRSNKRDGVSQKKTCQT
jgi:hypothetical protein